MTFRFFCAGLEVPAGTVGRFPKGQQILETLLPAFAYTALSFKEPDKELTAAFKRILESTENQQAITEYISNVNSNLAYTSTVGEIELVIQLASSSIAKEKPVTGTLFMPYSGLLVAKDSLFISTSRDSAAIYGTLNLLPQKTPKDAIWAMVK